MKKRSVTTTAIYMVAGQAILIFIVFMITALVFFGRVVTEIYDDMNVSITGAALAGVDHDDMKSLAKEVDSVIRKKGSFDEAFENEDEWLKAFAEIQASEKYKNVWERLNTERQGTRSTALDYVLIYPNDNMEVFIMDACDVNVLSCGVVHKIDTGAYVNQPKEDFDGFVTRSSTYGRLRTDGISVYLDTENGIYAYLLSDIPVKNVNGRILSFMGQTSLATVIATVLICFGVVRVLRRKVVSHITMLSDAAETFVSNYELRSGSHDESHIFDELTGCDITELCNLASSLQSMELEIGSYLRDLDHMAMERARIDTELDLARKIQAGVLSRDFSSIKEVSEFEIYATMAPAKEVGGDFYDFFMTDDDHLCLVIADVAGKGVPAALFMMIAKALIKNRMKSGDHPAAALENVNEQICEYNIGNMFVTVWLCVIDIRTGKATEVNAGHEHPVIKRKGGVYELRKYRHDIVVGAMPGIHYKEHEFELRPQDVLFVYTDGLPEATDRSEELFGTGRMMKVLNSNTDADPDGLLLSVKNTVGVFVGEREPFDDLTMMGIKWDPKGSETDSRL
ncbi:MAG: PP2C family protein-serine/threonine phosphatase [Lachnospiraceae bacterium]|nr:PP2C family protein-serine/threonine phosphatase [Lachnospiraceae bacterium]